MALSSMLKSDADLVMSDGMSLLPITEFTLFPQLPIEIRLKIVSVHPSFLLRPAPYFLCFSLPVSGRMIYTN
jgi:hypothetical protein